MAGMVLVAAPVALVLLVLASVTLGPAVLGWRSFVVTSASMTPTIPVGSVVVVNPGRKAALQPGDIGTFFAPESGLRVTHRVIGVSQAADGTRLLQTKGDATNTIDAPRRPEHVVGKVMYWVPYVGYVAVYANAPQFRVPLIVVVLALAVVMLARRHEGPRAKGQGPRAPTGQAAAYVALGEETSPPSPLPGAGRGDESRVAAGAFGPAGAAAAAALNELAGELPGTAMAVGAPAASAGVTTAPVREAQSATAMPVARARGAESATAAPAARARARGAPAQQAIRRAVDVLVVTAGVVALGLAAAVFGPLAFDLKPFAMADSTMEPAIPAGALVVAEKVAVTDLKEGDVVVYAPLQERGKVFTRRVASFERTGEGPAGVKITTKADRLPGPDAYTIDGTQTVGRVVYTVPFAGRVLSLAGGRAGFIALGAIVVLQLVARSLLRARGGAAGVGGAGTP